jgi:predicted Fe-Mo cluster-binding NifX family protein
MKIAIASQNRKTVTGHAGKCRKFWIFQIDGKQVTARNLLELPIEQSFHESDHNQPHPLDGIHVLISGSMGQGMQNRLKQKGILGVSTSETDLERAVANWLDGTLPEAAPDEHAHGHQHHHTHHGQGVA